MYKIGDFAKITKTSIKTLRYYDEINLFKPNHIDKFTGYRYYEKFQLNELNKIIELKSLGISLGEIQRYLELQDISILLNKENELKMKIEKITKYIYNNSYVIKEGTYNDYIKWNGLKEKGMPIALELKDNVAKYYMVFKDEEYFSEFFVFEHENNMINLNISVRFFEFFDYTLKYLKKYYEYIVFRIDDDLYNNAHIIREKCNCLEESIVEFTGNNNKIWKLTDIKVKL